MNMLMKRIFILLNKCPIIKKDVSVQLTIANNFHNNHQILYNRNNPNEEITPYRFNVQKKEKDTFLQIIDVYSKEDPGRVKQLQFISTALKYMDEFGVNKDLETYKAIFNIFPKEKYIPENKYQVMFYYYPKHQDVALTILNKMEKNFVIPDYELQEMIMDIFGGTSLVIKKCWSLLYWQPKFSKLNPWPVPVPTPTDPKELAQLGITKIAGTDAQANVSVYRTEDIPEAIDHTWIISTMSRSQQELLAVQPIDKSLTVEGPFLIWVDKYCINYFILKGDPIEREVIYDDYDDVADLKIPFWERHNFKIPLSVHEQPDGVCYAICATGTSSKDSLLSWIRCLQKTNPILEKLPITFKLKSASSQTSYIEQQDKTSNMKQISQNENVSEK